MCRSNRNDHSTVRRDGQGADEIAAPLETTSKLAGFDVPHHHETTDSAREDLPPVRRERELPHIARSAALTTLDGIEHERPHVDLPNLPSSLHVPQADRPIALGPAAAGRDEL